MTLIKHGGGGMNTSWEKRREPKCCRSRNWKADQNEWTIERRIVQGVIDQRQQNSYIPGR